MRRVRSISSNVVIIAALVSIAALPAGPAGAEDEGETAGIWSPAPAASEAEPGAPARYRLDHAGLQEVLVGPSADDGSRLSEVTVVLPRPDGQFEEFRVEDAPVMAPGLAAEHPEIRSFRGESLDRPGTTIRMSLTPLGLAASVRGGEGNWYVDRDEDADRPVYTSSFLGDADEGQSEPWVETVIDEFAPPPVDGPTGEASVGQGEPAAMRVFRLALASDPTYASYHGQGNVTAAKVELVNRINHVFESELAIRLALVAGNDSLNFNTQSEWAAAGYPAVNCNSIQFLFANDDILDATVGGSSYDVGHIILGRGGGGAAGVGTAGTSSKGMGCTGLNEPVGDSLAVDLFAHELGHQFGARHTFNGFYGMCHSALGHRAPNHSVEPGSGSTIMSYVGICGDDNLQPYPDPYFSQRSRSAFEAHIQNEFPDEPVDPSYDNRVPEVAVEGGDTHAIPYRTPFRLEAEGGDPDGDVVTYLWEQTDRGGPDGGTALADVNKTEGPLFRVFGTPLDASLYDGTEYYTSGHNVLSPDPFRVFPDLDQILAGNTNAATGTCPSGPDQLDCFSEWLPTEAYPGPMNFRVTARDGLGGVAFDGVTVELASGTGPFHVTSQATPATYQAYSTQTVTWDVSGTDAEPVGTDQVRIRFISGDGDESNVLLEATPNDGSAEVVIPNVATTRGRIVAEAVGNVFFAVNEADITVEPVIDIAIEGDEAEAGAALAGGTPAIVATDPGSAGSTLSLEEVTGLPPGLAFELASTTGDAVRPGMRTWALTGDVPLAPGEYPISFTVSGAGDRSTAGDFSLEIVDTTPPVISGVPQDRTVGTEDAEGAAVSYSMPVATDAVDGNLPVSCTPASGENFPPGTTTVSCSVSDAAGNVATATFQVRILVTEPEPGFRFDDVPEGHLFDLEIHWLAAADITRGCNPPDNTRFCPDDNVTRGQMAAFLNRALDLEPGDATFQDSDGHVFEDDIAALAAADITRGCNPPDNNDDGPPPDPLFCPDEPVTRGQMAAFIYRALRR